MRKPKKTSVAATKPCATRLRMYSRNAREWKMDEERERESETGDALKCCLSEDVSYPRERALVNRRRRLGAVATISHPLARPHTSSGRLPTCQTVGIVFEYVAYLLSASLLARCIVRTREKEQPTTTSIAPPPHRFSTFPSLPSLSLSNKKKKKEIPFLVRGDAAFLPSPPLRALLVAQSSLRSRVMRRSIQINLDTGKKSVSRPIPSWLGHQRKTSIFVSVGVRDPSDSGSLLALDHCRRERRREHASCITVL